MFRKRFSNQNQRSGSTNTAASQKELEVWGECLKEALLQCSPWLQLQVRCGVKQESFLVLIEHLLHIEPSPPQTFGDLERSLNTFAAELFQASFVQEITGQSKPLLVRSYLRIVGYQQPYASQEFTLVRPIAPALFEDLDPPTSPRAVEPAIVALEIPQTPEAVLPEPAPVAETQPALEQPEIVETIPVEETSLEPESVESELAAEIESIETVEEAEILTPQVAEPPAVELQAIEDEPVAAITVEELVAENEFVEPEIIEAESQAIEPLTGEAEFVEPQIIQNEVIEEEFVEPQIIEEEFVAEPEPQVTAPEIIEAITVDEFVDEPELVEPEPLEEYIVVPEVEPQFIESVSITEPKLEEQTSEPQITTSVPAEEAIAAPIFEPPAIEPVVNQVTSTKPSIFELESDEAITSPTPNSESEDGSTEPSEEPVQAETTHPQETIATPDSELRETYVAPSVPEIADPWDTKFTPNKSELEELIAEPKPETAAIDSEKDAEQQFSEAIAVEQPVELEKPAPTPLPPQLPEKPINPRFSPPNLMLTGAIGLFGLVSATYVLTRPCVLTKTCEPIQKAQTLNEQASKTIATTDSALAVVEAYDQLTAASYLLSSIPPWSGQYQTAQTLRSTYESKSKLIGNVVKALKQANLAAQKSQNPPHPLPEWRQIQWAWREAIAILEKVPSDSPISGLAQQKLNEYRVNLGNTDRRVIAEQNAQDKMTTARNTAQIAENRAGLAESSESWQQVYLTWEAALNLLQQIPQGTMVYAESQQLLSLYQPKMTEANNRRNQEKVSTGSYQQAVDLAEQARSWEQQNQWTQAVTAWRTALTNIQQIPLGTTYATQAQPLMGEYQTALARAEENLRRLTAMEAVKPKLDIACGGTTPVCTYTLAPEAIRVQITPQYDRTVESTIANAQAQSNSSARTEMVNQVNDLLRYLAGISESAQVSIELYNSNGSKFGTYAPNASAYVAR